MKENTQKYKNFIKLNRKHQLRTDISPEVFLFFLILLSEFSEGSILLLKALDLNLQLNQSLPQLSGLDLLAWGQGHTHTKLK